AAVRGGSRPVAAPAGRGACDLDALPAARAVADEAHGIQRLARAARRHEPGAAQVAARALSELPQGGLVDLLGLGHAPGPGVAARQLARDRPDPAHAPR